MTGRSVEEAKAIRERRVVHQMDRAEALKRARRAAEDVDGEVGSIAAAARNRGVSEDLVKKAYAALKAEREARKAVGT